MTTDMVTATPAEITTAGTTLAEHTAAWLWSYRESIHTRIAYQRDLSRYAAWCTAEGVDPIAADRGVLTRYAAGLAQGRAPATVARHLSALSSWYGYLVDVRVVAANPLGRVRRPRVDRGTSSTRSLTLTEVAAMVEAAPGDPVTCAVPLLLLLIQVGARASEVCALDVDSLGLSDGHRTVSLRMKGGKWRRRPLPPELATALDTYLDGRTSGPLFLHRGERVDRWVVYRVVQRLAKAAGVADPHTVVPHGLRHAWATIARLEGASLEDRQHALGHADPRTTMRYDHAARSLDGDPAYLVGAALRRATAAVGGHPLASASVTGPRANNSGHDRWSA